MFSAPEEAQVARRPEVDAPAPRARRRGRARAVPDHPERVAQQVVRDPDVGGVVEVRPARRLLLPVERAHARGAAAARSTRAGRREAARTRAPRLAGLRVPAATRRCASAGGRPSVVRCAEAHARPGAGREVAEEDRVLRVEGGDEQHGQRRPRRARAARRATRGRAARRRPAGRRGGTGCACRTRRPGWPGTSRRRACGRVRTRAIEGERGQHEQRRHREGVEEPVLVGHEGGRGGEPGGEREGQRRRTRRAAASAGTMPAYTARPQSEERRDEDRPSRARWRGRSRGRG